MKVFVVTGVIHGAIVEARNEAEARAAFQRAYKGEEIVCVKLRNAWP